MKTHQLDVAGESFFVQETGNGIPLVLLHGFPLEGRMWQAQWEALGDVARVIVPDLRGFGRSVVTPGTTTMEQMADDVAGIVAALDIREPIVLGGLSMGGYVAFQFVRKYGDRLRGLVLCDTRTAADTEEAAATRRKMARHVLEHGTGAVADAMLPKLFHPQTAERNAKVVESVRQMILSAPPPGVAAAQEGMAVRPDAGDLLATIRVPTLVVVGEEDAISPPAEMKAIADGIANAQYLVVTDAGHMAPMEQPTVVNGALRELLRSL